MRKLLVLTLTLLLLGSMVLFAGGGQEETTAARVEESGEYPIPLTLPLVKEPVTMTYFCAIDAKKIGVHTQDYNDLLQFQMFEEITGVRIDFKHPPAGQENEQFNLLVASASRPDMMFRGGWPSLAGGPQKLIDDGVFLDLSDYIPKYAPNLWGILTSDDPVYQKIHKDMMTDAGSYYVYPYARPYQTLKNFDGFLARGDWLTRTGLEPPQTIAEWEAALKFVKENDMNGNGDPNDEIPISSRTITDDNTLYNFAGAWGLHPYIFLKDGQVAFGAIEPEYKEYLKTMARWMASGYIDPDFSSLSVQQKQARIMDDRVAFFRDGLGMGLDVYVMGLGGQSDKVIPLNYPTLKEKSDTPTYFYGNNADFSGAGTAISATAKDPVLAAKWLDFWYSPQGSEIVNFGKEGVTFNYVNGYPQLVDDIYKNPKLSVSVALGRYVLGCSWGPFMHRAEVRNQRMLKWPQQVDAGDMWAKADLSGMIPFVSFSAEESSEAADIQNEIQTYVDEMTLKFIMGQADVDKDFDQFVSTVKKMNVERLIDLNSAAYGRYQTRKPAM